MKQMVLNLSALCVFAALFDQLIQDRGAMHALRVVLGVEIFRTAFTLLHSWISKII